MTDLEKAKQWLDSKEPSFGGDEVWTITRRNMAEVLAEYASHSNSELLERVQKLEQFLVTLADNPSYIVNSSLCSTTEIALARAACDGRWLQIGSLGFVRRDGSPRLKLPDARNV